MWVRETELPDSNLGDSDGDSNTVTNFKSAIAPESGNLKCQQNATQANVRSFILYAINGETWARR